MDQIIKHHKDANIPLTPEMERYLKGKATKTVIQVIYPYLFNETLVFDDESKELVKEAFVAGSDAMIILTAIRAGYNYQDLEKPFPLQFSDKYFPNSVKAERLSMKEYPCPSGRWYSVNGTDCWLCDATLCYFEEHPENIFFCVPTKENKHKTLGI